MTLWMEIDQDEKVLTGEDHGLQGRSPWKCPEILLLHLAVYSLVPLIKAMKKSLGRVRRMEARLVRKEKVVGIEMNLNNVSLEAYWEQEEGR